jgi:hypothetical protein
MRKIIVPIILTFTFLLVNSVVNAQTSVSDTTKKETKMVPKNKMKMNKKLKAEPVKHKDSTNSNQNKITVNEDGVRQGKKDAKGTKTNDTPSNDQPKNELKKKKAKSTVQEK